MNKNIRSRRSSYTCTHNNRKKAVADYNASPTRAGVKLKEDSEKLNNNILVSRSSDRRERAGGTAHRTRGTSYDLYPIERNNSRASKWQEGAVIIIRIRPLSLSIQNRERIRIARRC